MWLLRLWNLFVWRGGCENIRCIGLETLEKEFDSSRTLKDGDCEGPALESSGDKNFNRDRDRDHLQDALTKNLDLFCLT